METTPELFLAFTTVEAIGFAAGAELCLMLAFLQWRSAHPAMIWLWIAGIIWSGGSFVLHMMLLAGVPSDSAAARATEAISWSVSAFGPVPMMRSLRRMPVMARIAPYAVGASVLGGCVIFALFLMGAIIPESTLTIIDAAKISFFIALPQMLLFGYGHLGPHRKVAARAAGGGKVSGVVKAAAVIMAVWMGATLFSILAPYDLVALHIVFGLVSEMWVIPLAIVAAVSLAKTHYADVILKRSLGLLVSIVVATVLVWRTPGLPRGIPVVALSLLGSALMVTAPYLYRALGTAVDRLILKKPDYRVLAKAYGDEARRAPDLDSLLRLTEERVSSGLGLKARVSPAAPIDDAERIALAGGREVELSPRRRAKALMQAEMNFIEDVGAEFARREEALAFEDERRERETREARLTHAVTEAKLQALRAQVDPHFLFNTLNAITDLIATDPDKAETMTERLAAFFRYTLARQETGLSTLEEELDFVRQYLDIEKVRFGDRLKVEIEMDKGLGDEAVPSLILQPLVENALRHGLSSKLEGGKVRVTASRNGAGLKLEVQDDGVGFTAKSKPRVGLSNVRERLKAMHGDAAGMSIGKGPGGKGTSIILSLP